MASYLRLFENDFPAHLLVRAHISRVAVKGLKSVCVEKTGDELRLGEDHVLVIHFARQPNLFHRLKWLWARPTGRQAGR